MDMYMYIDIYTYTYLPPSTTTAPLHLYMNIYAHIDMLYIDMYVYRCTCIYIHASQHCYRPTADITKYMHI